MFNAKNSENCIPKYFVTVNRLKRAKLTVAKRNSILKNSHERKYAFIHLRQPCMLASQERILKLRACMFRIGA